MNPIIIGNILSFLGPCLNILPSMLWGDELASLNRRKRIVLVAYCFAFASSLCGIGTSLVYHDFGGLPFKLYWVQRHFRNIIRVLRS